MRVPSTRSKERMTRTNPLGLGDGMNLIAWSRLEHIRRML